MPMSCYDKGDLVRVSGAFTNAAGVATDPAVVNFSYLVPGSSTATVLVYGTDAALKRLSEGNYYVDISATLAGKYQYRWYSTGVGQAAETGEFVVEGTIL